MSFSAYIQTCGNCRKWLCQRVTDYGDGSRIVNFQSPPGKGLCEVLKIETDSTFGCNRFEEGKEHIEIMGKKPGSPWHHSQWGTCPDCEGIGVKNDAACRRCAQTGRVLYYDDGFIGEEQTRRHPNEALKGPPPKPHCFNCSAEIDPNWKACPTCGEKVERPADPIRVTETFQNPTT